MDNSRATEESFRETDSRDEFSDEDVWHSATEEHTCAYDGCDKSFVRLDRFLQHQRVHTGERPYICTEDNCSKSYTRSSHLKRHIKQSHTEVRTPADVEICQFEGCYKTFVSKDNLRRHRAQVHENASRKYLCGVIGCGKAFSKRFQLRAHEYEHKGVEPFQCHIEDCKKKFKQKSHLVRHLKSHEGYKCELDGCKESFEKWTQLRRHKALKHKNAHKKDRGRTGDAIEDDGIVEKFVCNYEGCDRSYTRLSNLKHHVGICHDGSLLFQCHVGNCKFTFASKQKLQNHIRMHENPPVRQKVKRVVKARRRIKKQEVDEFKLSDICEGLKSFDAPSLILEPLIPRPQNSARRLLSEEQQMIERMKRKEWRTRTLLKSQLDELIFRRKSERDL